MTEIYLIWAALYLTGLLFFSALIAMFPSMIVPIIVVELVIYFLFGKHISDTIQNGAKKPRS